MEIVLPESGRRLLFANSYFFQFIVYFFFYFSCTGWKSVYRAPLYYNCTSEKPKNKKTKLKEWNQILSCIIFLWVDYRNSSVGECSVLFILFWLFLLLFCWIGGFSGDDHRHRHRQCRPRPRSQRLPSAGTLVHHARDIHNEPKRWPTFLTLIKWMGLYFRSGFLLSPLFILLLFSWIYFHLGLTRLSRGNVEGFLFSYS